MNESQVTETPASDPLTTAQIANTDSARDSGMTNAEAAVPDEGNAEDGFENGSSGERGGSLSADGAIDVDPGASLLPAEETDRFRADWKGVQGEFVDQPRVAVERADQLVAALMQRLAAEFSETRTRLEDQWDGHADASTEDLRVAMTRYRSFFERLLSA